MGLLARANRHAIVLVALSSFGCSSQSTADHPGADAAVAEVGLDAVLDAESANGDAPIGGPDAQSCSEISAKAAALMGQTQLKLTDLSCQTDDDCVFASADTLCSASCGSLMNRSGFETLQAVIAVVEQICYSDFLAQGCQVLPLPCPAPQSAACVAGTCADFPTARWLSFAIDKNSGDVTSASPTCTAGDCTVWKVTPDGAIAKLVGGVGSKATLSAADLVTVDGILRGMNFRTGERQGFQCGPRPAGGGVAFSVARQSATVGFDVSGCMSARDTDPERLFRVISAY